jgi:hypothetical protein
VKIPIVGVIVGLLFHSLSVRSGARVDERVQAFPPKVRGKRHATRSDPSSNASTQRSEPVKREPRNSYPAKMLGFQERQHVS